MISFFDSGGMIAFKVKVEGGRLNEVRSNERLNFNLRTLNPVCFHHLSIGASFGHQLIMRSLFDDLAFDVVDQVAEGDRVASRWVLIGSNRGRPVRLWGITISRLRDGRIVEDWSAFDGLELLRALGIWRTLLIAPGFLRPLLKRRPSGARR